MTSKQETRRKSILAVAYQDYSHSLNLHAFFKIQDHEIGKDLVQETFIKTWSYLVKGGKIDLMKAFLYHVLNNLIVDEYRKHKTTSLNVLIEKGREPHADYSNRFFNILDGKTAILLIQSLPLKYQKIIRMRYIKNFSIKEMSLITGQSKNAVAVQIHRGLAKLKLLHDPE